MPRDLPLGNGSLLINFDAHYQLRDVYWPHVGLENHSKGAVSRFGVWVDGRFKWIDDLGWSRDLRYAGETLIAEVKLAHPELQLEIVSHDAVDFHENLYVRRLDISNPTDRERDVRVFFHHDLNISSHEVGDTAIGRPGIDLARRAEGLAQGLHERDPLPRLVRVKRGGGRRRRGRPGDPTAVHRRRPGCAAPCGD